MLHQQLRRLRVACRDCRARRCRTPAHVALCIVLLTLAAWLLHRALGAGSPGELGTHGPPGQIDVAGAAGQGLATDAPALLLRGRGLDKLHDFAQPNQLKKQRVLQDEAVSPLAPPQAGLLASAKRGGGQRRLKKGHSARWFWHVLTLRCAMRGEAAARVRVRHACPHAHMHAVEQTHSRTAALPHTPSHTLSHTHTHTHTRPYPSSSASPLLSFTLYARTNRHGARLSGLCTRASGGTMTRVQMLRL